MYVPKPFACTDENELLAFARSNSFATLVTRDEMTGISATHVPVLVDAAQAPTRHRRLFACRRPTFAALSN
jgi:predicted FMN-binding regulatory protein PaiB